MPNKEDIKDIAICAKRLADKSETDAGLSPSDQIVFIKLVKSLCKYIGEIK